jgi:hypothetical protein
MIDILRVKKDFTSVMWVCRLDSMFWRHREAAAASSWLAGGTCHAVTRTFVLPPKKRFSSVRYSPLFHTAYMYTYRKAQLHKEHLPSVQFNTS